MVGLSCRTASAGSHVPAEWCFQGIPLHQASRPSAAPGGSASGSDRPGGMGGERANQRDGLDAGNAGGGAGAGAADCRPHPQQHRRTAERAGNQRRRHEVQPAEKQIRASDWVGLNIDRSHRSIMSN